MKPGDIVAGSTPAAQPAPCAASKPPKPMRVEKNSAHSDNYIGTRHQLIAAGIVKPGQFPGDDPTGPKQMVSYLKGGVRVRRGQRCWDQPGSLVIRRSGSLFSACVGVSEEERTRREAEHDRDRKAQRAKYQQEREANGWLQRAERDLLGVMTSVERFLNLLRHPAHLIAELADSPLQIYSLDEKSVAKLRSLGDEMVRVVASGSVREKDGAPKRLRDRVAVAKDAALQRFLQVATTAPFSEDDHV